MKLTTKILLIIFSTLILFMAGSLVYFNSFAEVTPAPLVKETVRKTIDLTGVKHLRFGRGLWIIKIYQSDSSIAGIEGADNLINNYSRLETRKDTLIIDVDDEFKYDNTWQNYIRIELQDISSINLSHNAHVTLYSFRTDTLNVNIANLSSMNIYDGKIIFLRLSGTDYGSIYFKNTEIGEMDYNLSGKSILTGINCNIVSKGVCLDKSSCYIVDKEGNEQIVISDSLKQKRSNQQEFLPGLKIFGFHQEIIESAKSIYKLGETRESNFKADSVRETEALFINTNFRTSDYYRGGEIFNIPVDHMVFYFSNGLLTGFSFAVYDGEGGTKGLYTRILDSLTVRYGKAPMNIDDDENHQNIYSERKYWLIGGDSGYYIYYQRIKTGYLNYSVTPRRERFVFNMDDDEFLRHYHEKLRYIRMYNWERAKSEIFSNTF